MFIAVSPALLTANANAAVLRQRVPESGRAVDMKIGQTIKERGTSLSFEFFPPRDKVGEDRLFESIAKLGTLNPTFVSVTCGAGGGTLKNTRQVVQRIQRETSLVPMPHLTCLDH